MTNVKPNEMVIGKHYTGYVGPANGWVYMGEYLGHHPDDPNSTRWKDGSVPVVHLNGRNVQECTPEDADDGGLRHKLETLAQYLERTANMTILDSGSGMARDVARQIRALLKDTE